MPREKSEYEKMLDDFYQIEEDDEALIQHSVRKVSKDTYKELFNKAFKSLTKEERERLKKEHGTEWEHIENHFRRLAEDGE